MDCQGLLLTYEVPAATGSGASDPVALEYVDGPLVLGVFSQRVRAQVADLHLVVVGLEVIELHPGLTKNFTSCLNMGLVSRSFVNFKDQQI